MGIVTWIGTSNDYSLDRTLRLSTDDSTDESASLLSDRDSAAEEVRAVATKIANLEQALETQQAINQSERDQLREDFRLMFEELHQTLDSNASLVPVEMIFDSIDEVSNRLRQLETEQTISSEHTGEVPTEPTQFVWYESSDQGDRLLINGQFIESELISADPASPYHTETALLQSPPRQAHYTIPPTTTLLHATAMTALVGRIPVNGRLHDPWRFKIIVGAANLAANGHTIPQLAGMLWAGTARGDFSLSCVSGNVDTATFIFLDGSIQTTQIKADPDGSSNGLGWISDEYGNPCIAGDLKSNAIRYLTQATLVNTTQATAEAIANAQTDSSIDPQTGESTTRLTGDIDQYVAGYATQQSLSEISKWLAERQLTSFDAIYVPAGKEVAIHIEEPILIDHDPSGRKVHYAGENAPLFTATQGWTD